MTLKNILGKISLFSVAILCTQSCKKESSIDNNNVIQRPYVIYAVDTNGYIYKSNDGEQYKTIFPGDGKPLRAITTSKENIVFVKNQFIYYSDNEGVNFVQIKPNLVNIPTSIVHPNIILDVPALQRLYITNQLGIRGKISYSPKNGEYFIMDTLFTSADSPFVIESYAYTPNGLLYGYSNSGSVNGVTKLFYKAGADAKWTAQSTNLPNPNNFYLSPWDNKLLATDYNGNKGVWYSDDTGKNFQMMSGLPTSKLLLSNCAAYDKLLVGVQEDGVYVYNGSSFVPSSVGLPSKTSVYGIVAKGNYYKNEQQQKLFYIATNHGIFKSEDLGQSWILVKEGKYTLIN